MPRAIKSLINQTFKDWVCEVHNDCPEDPFPGQYISSLNDSRFIIKNHPENLGGTGSFNLAFQGCQEEYVSILEDDNWWEPNFLEEMMILLDKHGNVDVAWANMRIWNEKPNNQWTDSGNTTWDTNTNLTFSWPQHCQAMGALHSIGAMIYRSSHATDYLIPSESLLDAVELIRERTFKHPIILNSRVLANYSVTAFTHRSKEKWKWTATQVMLLITFIQSSHNEKTTYKTTLNYYRNENPNTVINFFLANLLFLKKNAYYKHLTPYDYLIFAKWLLKNGFKLKKIKQYLGSQISTLEFLSKTTELRHNDNNANTYKLF